MPQKVNRPSTVLFNFSMVLIKNSIQPNTAYLKHNLIRLDIFYIFYHYNLSIINWGKTEILSLDELVKKEDVNGVIGGRMTKIAYDSYKNGIYYKGKGEGHAFLYNYINYNKEKDTYSISFYDQWYKATWTNPKTNKNIYLKDPRVYTYKASDISRDKFVWMYSRVYKNLTWNKFIKGLDTLNNLVNPSK